MGPAWHVSRSVDCPQRRIGEFRKVAIAIARRLLLWSNRNHQGRYVFRVGSHDVFTGAIRKLGTACPILTRYSFHSFSNQHYGDAWKGTAVSLPESVRQGR